MTTPTGAQLAQSLRLLFPGEPAIELAAQRLEARAEKARLIAAASDLLEAVAGDDPEMPAQIRPIEWLHTLLHDAEKIHSVLDGDDPGAVEMMLDELRTMVTKVRAALEAVAREE
jgi:hypothetical protein